MTSIVPLTDLRNTSKIYELSENEPVFITKNGRGSRVLLNIDTYNEMKELILDIELEQEYLRSERDGDNVDALQYLRTLKKTLL